MKFFEDERGDTSIIVLWIFVALVMFILALSYFTLYEMVAVPLTDIGIFGHEEFTNGSVNYDIQPICNRLIWYWRYAHIIVAVGTLVYAIMRSIRKEHHSYRY